MPTYRVTDHRTGRVVRLTGDSPPTEVEMEEVFASLEPLAPASRDAVLPPNLRGGGRSTEPSSQQPSAGGGMSFAQGVRAVASADELEAQQAMAGVPARAVNQAATTWVDAGPSTVKRGLQDVGRGNVARGARQVIRGSAITAAPMLAPQLLAGVAAAPVATAAGIAGGAAVAKGTEAGMRALGASEDQAGLVGDIAGMAGGAVASQVPGAIGKRLAPMLRDSAEKSMAQALGATTNASKAEAAKLAPEMLKRGVKGSRQAMFEQAKEAAAAAGARLSQAYTDAAKAGTTVSGLQVRGHVQLVSDALKVRAQDGSRVVVPGTERVIQQLENLDRFVASLGDDIPVDRAAAVKQTWDRIVDKAGLFGAKATSSATDNADAWAIREASGAFRELLNANPTIADLNREVGFWSGLRTVLSRTRLRTQSQSGGGLISNVAGIAGAGAGYSTSGVVGAAIGGAGARQLALVLQSPWFRTTAAGPFKKALADALASGNATTIRQAAMRAVVAAQPVSRAVGGSRPATWVDPMLADREAATSTEPRGSR